ncbi:MAG: pyridoxamine 5'-phosphate oxidase family protein [Phycisphaeraceae bacterium]|nr:pyridoxamine 5'-phosphate oxidase family protein [Phycisphaeraceae bacterium]
MVKIECICREVLEQSKWIAIATTGLDGPHVVATWGDYVRALGIREDTLLVPVGGMRKTEANLKCDPRVELLCGTRQVQGAYGPGKGCAILGRAEVQIDGPEIATVRAAFPWARAVLVVKVEKIESQL